MSEKIRILVEPVRNGFVATAFDAVGMIDSAKASTHAVAVAKLKRKVEQVIDVKEYIVEAI